MSFNTETAGIWNPQPYALCWWYSPFTTTKWKSTPKKDLPPGQEWMDAIIFTYGYMTENNLEAMEGGDKAKFIQMLGKEKRKPVYLLWPQDRSSVWFLPCVFSDQHRLRTQLNQGPVLPGSVQDGEGVHMVSFVDVGDAIQAPVHTFPLNAILLLDVCI